MDVRPFSDDGSLDTRKITFQIVIYNTGVIQIFYKSKLRTPYSAIVGLSPGDGLGGVQNRLPLRPSFNLDGHRSLPAQTSFRHLITC